MHLFPFAKLSIFAATLNLIIMSQCKPYVLGIDMGGTNTVIGLVDARGKIVSTAAMKTRDYAEFEDFTDALCRNAHQLMSEADALDMVGGIGIGAPNANYYSGTIEEAPNLPWRGILPLGEALSQALDIPVTVTNDANAAAIGEMTYGAARGMRDFIMITLGTGVGGGIVLDGNILKVDSFLNHQIDVGLYEEMAREWKRLFEGTEINKILTIEASGIGMACFVGREFGCPVVFAKKNKSSNIGKEFYTAKVMSYTHGTLSDVIVSKKYLGPDDKILIIDDFLANGCALEGLIDIVESAGARIAGAGIVIEKGQQDGGKRLRERGIRIESLAIIDHMDPATGEIVFRS